MKIVYPEYLKNFKCLAGECPDTCCAGWQIVVDRESVEKYSGVAGSFGDKLRTNMICDGEGDIVFRSDKGRCPFLNKNNLCDIHINCGKDYLCSTCRMFPVFLEEYGSVREEGLGLACPKAAEMITEYNGKWEFLEEASGDFPLPNDIDPELYFALVNVRKKMFNIVFDEKLTVGECLNNILCISEKCQKLINSGEYGEISGISIAAENSERKLQGERCVEILSKLEILTDRWKNILSVIDCSAEINYSEKYRSIAAYWIYRYFLKSVFDGDVKTKIRFCLFSCEVIARCEMTGLSVAEAAQIYSKEIEYSAENTEKIYIFLQK